MTVIRESSFLRVLCDRAGCSKAIAHIDFAFDDSEDDVTEAMIIEQWPYTDVEAKKRLCAECLAGAREGRIEVRWKR